MPNWAESDFSAVLPTRRVREFTSLFLSHTARENEGKKEFFARTFVNDISEEKNDRGMSLLHISAECAWSMYCCLIKGYPNKGGDHTCPTLKDALDRYEVKRFTGMAREPGIGFEETITFNRDEDDEVHYDSRDVYPDPWNEFLDDCDIDMKSENTGGDIDCQIG